MTKQTNQKFRNRPKHCDLLFDKMTSQICGEKIYYSINSIQLGLHLEKNNIKLNANISLSINQNTFQMDQTLKCKINGTIKMFNFFITLDGEGIIIMPRNHKDKGS